MMDDCLLYAKEAAKILLEPLSLLDRVEVAFSGTPLTPEQTRRILEVLGDKMEEK